MHAAIKPVIAVLVFMAASLAQAQSFEEWMRGRSDMAPDLKFPAEAQTLSSSSPLEMAIYKPEGAGPFPVLFVVHTCGGLRPEIREWTTLALAQGYVVFVMDSYSQRGLKNACAPSTPGNNSRGTKDAFDALEHLKKFTFVDQERIGMIGFSWGAMVGQWVSSKEVARIYSPGGKRFQAAVALYPLCYFPAVRAFREIEFLRADTDKPLLTLMGELDNETPPSDCIPRLESLKAKGAPVEWHVFPQATHCWDCSTLDNFSKRDWKGTHIVYRYNRETTQDSAKRSFEFLAKHLKFIR